MGSQGAPGPQQQPVTRREPASKACEEKAKGEAKTPILWITRETRGPENRPWAPCQAVPPTGLSGGKPEPPSRKIPGQVSSIPGPVYCVPKWPKQGRGKLRRLGGGEHKDIQGRNSRGWGWGAPRCAESTPWTPERGCTKTQNEQVPRLWTPQSTFPSIRGAPRQDPGRPPSSSANEGWV